MSDAHSQSQMTTDTYGYEGGGGGGDQNIIWSDDPETAYLRSMIRDKEDSSLIGEATVNSLLQERGAGRAVDGAGHYYGEDDNSSFLAGGAAGGTPTSRMDNTSRTDASFEPMIDSSGLSYYDTDADDDTIGKIQADADDSGWFAARRQKFENNHPPPNHLNVLGAVAHVAPSPRMMAYDTKSPISALSPQDKAGEGNGTSARGFAVPNPNLVPSSPGKRPVPPLTPADGEQIMADLEGYTEDGKIIPGYIFVTAGHSSAVQTKKSPNGKSKDNRPRRSRFSFGGVFGSRTDRPSSVTPKVSNKKAPPPPIVTKEPPSKFLTVDTQDEEERRRRRKYFLCKVGIVFLMMALAVGIAMLSIVFKSKRSSGDTTSESNDVGSPPTMPPNFFLPAQENTPTATPTSPPRGGATNSPTAGRIGEVDTASPSLSVTPVGTGAPSMAPAVTATGAPSSSAVEALKVFLMTQFPSSETALADTTSAQYRALEWIAQDTTTATNTGNRRFRGRVLQQEEMNWRLVQRWTLAVFYFATGGNLATGGTSTWTSEAGWLQFPDECEWAFVTCNEDARVRDLVIQENSLVGSIPPEVGLFGDALFRLSLNGNAIEGSLPTTLGLLKGLNRFTMTGNKLMDRVPTEIGDMTGLQFIAVGRTLLSGPIPSELGNVAGLKTLDFALSNISGSIPTELGKLLDLEFISLGSTQVSGTLPSEMGDLPLLIDVKVARTNLGGQMPSGICNRDLGGGEIRADCQELDCPCCTICCVDGGSCSASTASPTQVTTLKPETPAPTAKTATVSPTKVTTPGPTLKPTASPTIEAVLRTTEVPTTSPTPKPTAETIPAQTSSPTAAESPTVPMCEAEISTDEDCYENGDDVTVFFDNCNPLIDDWIGVYPDGTDLSVLDEPIAWVWTAGNQFMQIPVSSGNITFSEARGTGIFRVVIARNRPGPPYRAYGVSNTFRLTESCAPA